jgi:putative aminopeptidase FrvX
MEIPSLLEVIRSILIQPTAPFHEDAVRAEISRRLAQCPHVSLELDDYKNLIALYSNGKDRAPRYAFAAHMDHPGFVKGEFMGGVSKEYLDRNPPTRDFGEFAMWDLPAFRVEHSRIYSRACDDLVGCAVIVAAFQELECTGTEAACYGLFTRAEEVGLVGANLLARSGRIPRDVTIVSLETSSERGGNARMGAGVVIRVGDRTSIFDDAATATLAKLAIDKEIPFQRCLMSGGTCEGTIYQLHGYRTTALCVALGNYHNCGPDTTIDSEYVSCADVEAMTNLCTTAAQADELVDVRAQRVESFGAAVEKQRQLL